MVLSPCSSFVTQRTTRRCCSTHHDRMGGAPHDAAARHRLLEGVHIVEPQAIDILQTQRSDEISTSILHRLRQRCDAVYGAGAGVPRPAVGGRIGGTPHSLCAGMRQPPTSGRMRMREGF